VGRCLTQESKFLVLNKKAAWDSGLSVNLAVSDDGLKIRQVFEYVSQREDDIEVLADSFEVTDFAVAACSQLYILDAVSRAIWIYDTEQKTIEKIACIGALFEKPKSITYAAGTLYVADAEAEARIYALAELNWQIKFTVGASPGNDLFPLAKPFAPIDLAVDAERHLFALDDNNRAIVRFDEAGQVVDVFGQAELQNQQPTSLALSRDGFLYVLDARNEKVLRFSTGKTGAKAGVIYVDFKSAAVSKFLPDEFRPSGFAIDEGGILYVGDNGPRPLVGQEDDRFIHKFGAAGKYAGVVEDFRGAVDQMVIDLDNSIFVFRADVKNKITALRRELKFAQAEGAALIAGLYISMGLDSADAGTIWHKFSAGINTPASTQIRISFLAADKSFLIGADKQDLDSFLAETASLDEAIDSDRIEKQQRLADLDRLDWSRPVLNANDALLTAAGRYLWARIELIGSAQESPSVHSLQVNFPRLSYLRYLPAVYQEDETSRDFLERFLSLFETFFDGLESQVNHVARYVDPDSSVAQGEFLRWLATWLAIPADNSWDDARLRSLIKRAAQIYKYRGTRAAIEEMIELFLGERPLIVEHYQTSCAGWAAQNASEEFDKLRELYERLYGKDPFCFCVLLKPFPMKMEEQRKAVSRIINSEKPAHTCAGLMILQPWVQLDTHTYLELNTYLSEPTARLDFGSSMPRDTVLNDFEETGQLERRSRLNSDIKLT